ncbi:T9SS type B sorting domain-containing protein [Mucilaginibacter glaciei]|uniref:Gliding motility-associated C-terminal domain-containing protein n=1 Tax=Mucilaginibacter glaciei TaxID=2772109 RepID=A0A926NSK5_9SPHI|nr:T9SS type B sorting domain-containing protein [Mucilaginibacter glaciei]MBD1394247.1 gliding motility-associated C-terminal domain-containing protein [Mucilaginibacter glaciei]
MLRSIALFLLLSGLFFGCSANAATNNRFVRAKHGSNPLIPAKLIKQATVITINATAIILKPAACTTNNGAITGIVITNTDATTLLISWKDQTGTEWGTTTNLINIPAGSYTLTVTTADGTASQTYGPVILKNTDVPVINQTNPVIISTLCGQFAGSITGITATGTGTLTYSWISQYGTEVSNTLPLLNKTGGKYRLMVTDANGCTAMSTELEIPEINGVSLNTTNGQALSASCEKANGSIIGLQTVGATQITWTRQPDNVVVGNQIELKNVPAGDYKLTYSNSTCSKSSDFTINSLASSSFGDITVKATNTCDAFVTGKIEVNTDNAVEVPAAYRWVNANGDNAAFGKVAQFLAAGIYKLYLTNKYGCENFYREYSVGKYPPFVNTQFGTITNIKCGIGRGSITGIAFTGGTGNYVYEWYGTDGTLITGKTEPFLDDLSPGKYTLRTTDGGCSLSENIYTIIDEEAQQAPPVVPYVNLLSAGQATINVTNPYTTAIYRLYDSETAITPVDEQRGGTFAVNVTQSKSFYVTLTFGYCESERVEVKITVDPTVNEIANTFTPNGDGVNDYWKITGLDGQSNATVSIFTRNGSLIFQSLGYARPFDGTYRGKALPAGVYYYTIKLKASKVIAGHLTIIR